jgi:N-sulfoglucosamine sulfohydrolase
MARGKRYLEDSGVRVPMIVRLPAKWSHLSPFPAGSAVAEPVAFVDLAPTVLSLAGIATPPSMQGRAFLGEHRAAPRDLEFLFGDRFDETPGMRRAVTDGKYKYIRCFTPHLPGAPFATYPLGQPSWRAWQQAAEAGALDGYHASLWQTPRPTELLFELASDPWEIHDLAADPAHADALETMRAGLRRVMNETRDTGVVPEAMWPELTGENGTIHGFVAAAGPDHARWVDLAILATEPAFSPRLAQALGSDCPVARYWAAMACRIHGPAASAAADTLEGLREDPSPTVRAAARDALKALGR